MLKMSVRKKQVIQVAKYAVPVAVVVLSPSMAFANDYDVSGITKEFTSGEAAVATVASASVGMFIVKRIWKIVRGAI